MIRYGFVSLELEVFRGCFVFSVLFSQGRRLFVFLWILKSQHDVSSLALTLSSPAYKQPPRQLRQAAELICRPD